MKINEKHVKSGDRFFKSILKNNEVRVKYEEEKINSEIAIAVRKVRITAKLTQSKLAEKIGTSQSVIARLESGTDTRTPSLDLLARIGKVCKAHLEVGFRFKHAS
ncbi:MAG TPA: helix-turn-helix transcriptional regulator [bacterium]|nr:helix-turn-helix transcriptional regulator [bacterium]